MSHLFPNYARFPLSIVKGEGNYVWDEKGNKYLDAMSGIAVTSLGHGPEKVKAKLMEQLDTLWHCSNLFHIPLQEELASFLARISGLDRVFFCNSGAEANEAAIKLARKFGNLQSGGKKHEIITFQQSFHGRTLATLTATGQDKVKEGFSPLPEGFVTVPFNDTDAFQNAINDRTCAVLLEVIQGEGGVRPVDPDWVKDVQKVCNENGILFMIDEIQTGIGRTGNWFAYQAFGLDPDIITLAKGLGSGFPVAAMLGKSFLADAFGPGSHGSTFGGNPLAAAAALATLETMEEEQCLSRVKEKGALLERQLQALAEQSDGIEEVRGIGLMQGVQLRIPAIEVVHALREKGILLLVAGPKVLRIVPPFTITEEEIGRIVDTLAEVLKDKAKQTASS